MILKTRAILKVRSGHSGEEDKSEKAEEAAQEAHFQRYFFASIQGSSTFSFFFLVTVFLCLVNIFNSITSKIPKADGLTAIEAFIIICIIFVFGALMGKYKFIKIETNNSQLSNDTAEG